MLTSKLAILCRRDDFSADIRSTSWLTCHKRRIPEISTLLFSTWLHHGFIWSTIHIWVLLWLLSDIKLVLYPHPTSHEDKGVSDFLIVLSQQYWFERTLRAWWCRAYFIGLHACLYDMALFHWLVQNQDCWLSTTKKSLRPFSSWEVGSGHKSKFLSERSQRQAVAPNTPPKQCSMPSKGVKVLHRSNKPYFV